jgi:hypothetical protein
MANLPFATIDSHARALGKPSMSQHDRDLVLEMVPRFETSLNYTIGDKELWALQLKYVNGNLDTLEKQRQITLGVGVKY